jgi:hypothetical protein
VNEFLGIPLRRQVDSHRAKQETTFCQIENHSLPNGRAKLNREIERLSEIQWNHYFTV